MSQPQGQGQGQGWCEAQSFPICTRAEDTLSVKVRFQGGDHKMASQGAHRVRNTRGGEKRSLGPRGSKPSTVEVRGPPSAPEGLCPPKREFTLSLRAHQLPVTSYQFALLTPSLDALWNRSRSSTEEREYNISCVDLTRFGNYIGRQSGCFGGFWGFHEVCPFNRSAYYLHIHLG